jgi:hypothetical protein
MSARERVDMHNGARVTPTALCQWERAPEGSLRATWRPGWRVTPVRLTREAQHEDPASCNDASAQERPIDRWIERGFIAALYVLIALAWIAIAVGAGPPAAAAQAAKPTGIRYTTVCPGGRASVRAARVPSREAMGTAASPRTTAWSSMFCAACPTSRSAYALALAPYLGASRSGSAATTITTGAAPTDACPSARSFS